MGTAARDRTFRVSAAARGKELFSKTSIHHKRSRHHQRAGRFRRIPSTHHRRRLRFVRRLMSFAWAAAPSFVAAATASAATATRRNRIFLQTSSSRPARNSNRTVSAAAASSSRTPELMKAPSEDSDIECVFFSRCVITRAARTAVHAPHLIVLINNLVFGKCFSDAAFNFKIRCCLKCFLCANRSIPVGVTQPKPAACFAPPFSLFPSVLPPAAPEQRDHRGARE